MSSTASSAGRSAEYDAFGPWIDEIHAADDVPRLFRDHPLDLAAQRLVLKVPRNIARRDATASMDLYDHLLAVGPTALTVLTRGSGGYGEAVVPYGQIAALEDSVNLLDGRLTLRTLGGDTVAIPYNAASQEVIVRLVRILRGLVGATDAPPPAPGASSTPSALPNLGPRDVGLVTSWRDVLREEPGMRVLAAHRRRALVPRGSMLTRALHLARPMTLQGAIVCSNGTDLEVLGRRDWLIRGNRAVHSLARLVVPLSRLDGVTTADHPRYLGVRVATLRIGATRIDLPVPAGSAAERALLDCVAPAG